MLILVLVVGVSLEIAIVVGFVKLLRRLLSIGQAIDQLRLTSRARIQPISIFNKTDPEAQLRRLGRSSRNHRQVVGGDPESELRQELERTVLEDGGIDEANRLQADKPSRGATQRRSTRYVGGDGP